MQWRDDFTYYYYDAEGQFTASSLSKVPDEIEDFANIFNAVGFVQKLGCIGASQHKVRSQYHQLCLDVLKIAVEKYGEIIPVAFRGIRSRRTDDESLILFASTEKAVAEFYAIDGDIREYHNIRGLRVNSQTKSVISEGWDLQDEEIIFFPSRQ